MPDSLRQPAIGRDDAVWCRTDEPEQNGRVYTPVALADPVALGLPLVAGRRRAVNASPPSAST